MGRAFVLLGILLLAAGLVLTFFPRSFAWFGHLPGDIDVRRGGTRVFIPVVSMLVISLLVTLIVNVVAWLARILR